ncbi:uncharacterized protein LOC113311011 [Papaver somniferum]|uniref:uncharacterized protein LOC113311011 n=1 Tax=Papaver somniferum TaxID=3469 RepID=UPI000E702D06|nr:uncharacterized protein LOC113311011 [Papaver somniferum]
MEPKKLRREENPVRLCSTYANPRRSETSKSNYRRRDSRDEGVRHRSHPLDLGKFPSWDFPVTVGGKKIRYVDIHSPDDKHVIGLPLGLDVPKVIADNYKGLLRMVSGMRNIITDTIQETARYKNVAALRSGEVNYYRREYSKLLSAVGGGKLEDVLSSGPKTVSAATLLAQESYTKENENDRPLDIGKASQGKGVVDIRNLSSSPEVETTLIDSLESGEITDEPMEVTSKTSSSDCLTPDSTALTVDTMEGFELLVNCKLPVEYANLYKQIHEKYGHMATKKVVKFNDDILLTCVTSLLKIISSMETVRGVELSEALLETWDGHIKDAEALQFNVKWLRERFNLLENHWKSSFVIDKDVESHVQVLDAMQVNYVGLWTRKDKLDVEFSDVRIQIKKAEAMISSEREAIHDNLARKFIFYDELVLGKFLS